MYRCDKLWSKKVPRFDRLTKTNFSYVYKLLQIVGTVAKSHRFPDGKQKEISTMFIDTFVDVFGGGVCDVLDFSTAKYCADKAYSMQGGGKGYESELSLVYKRIQKEAPDLFED